MADAPDSWNSNLSLITKARDDANYNEMYNSPVLKSGRSNRGIVNVAELQKLEVARSYQWGVEFSDYPGQAIFPCHMLSDTKFSFGTDTVKYGTVEFSYPNMARRGDIQLQIYETTEYEICLYLRSWAATIMDQEKYTVRLLHEPGVAKQITIYNLAIDTLRPVVSEYLLVIPDGDVTYENSSEKSGALDISLTLKVVGDFNTSITWPTYYDNHLAQQR